MEIIVFLLTALILLIVIVLVIGFGAYFKVKNSVKKFAPELSNVKNLKELAKRQETELRETPKSVSGMEAIERPRIERDFKDMSLDELKNRNADEVFAYFKALETGDDSYFAKNESVNDQISKLSKETSKNKEQYKSLKIHRQSVSRYEKTNDVPRITFQMAVEYIRKDGFKYQTRITTQWIYLPEAANFSGKGNISFNCKNCGAPISNIQNKECEYCHSGVEIDYTKAWELSSIEED